ncbi:MAG: hypothetical protein ACRENH_05045, partial [Gemmatimonadaceae bacterium]
ACLTVPFPAGMMWVRMLRLVTFGGLALERPDGSPPPRLRPQRLAILSVLASAGDRGVSRERMSGLFWPDADEERARHSLRQALYSLRQELGTEVVQSDALLALDRTALGSDIADFRTALTAGDRARAASLATGPFLHGFYLAGSPEFERWVEEERAAIAAETSRVLLALTKEAESAHDHDAGAEWWRRLTVLDPLSGRYALGYLKALAARGDRAGALAFARAHESIVRRELEADADPEIRRLEAELRAMPSPIVLRSTPTKATATPVTIVGASNDSAALVASQLQRLTEAETAPRDFSSVAADLTPPPAPNEPAALAAAQLQRLSEAATAPRDFSSVVAQQPRAANSRRWKLGTAVALVLFGVAAIIAASDWSPLRRGSTVRPSTFAVGMIHEEGVPDTLRIGGVLTDMLATNLARVAGLTVLANTRLFELMRPGQDTIAAGYTDAARRAGATEILQGRLLAGPQWSLAIEIQRVDLTSGLVKGAYRVSAQDRYQLIDSMTAAITRDLHLGVPPGPVAEATTQSPVAYRLYEEGLRAYYQYDEAAAIRLMKAALREDSTFAMAAYYDARLSREGDGDETERRERALRLAARAPERERLTITATMLMMNQEPTAIAVAETLVTKFPSYPRALQLLAQTLSLRGDWDLAIKAIERAIAMDSVSEPVERQGCSLCLDLVDLAEFYFWWDSVPAAERTAQRFLRLRPKNPSPWSILVRSAAARGDTAATDAYLRRFAAASSFPVATDELVRRLILSERYDEAALRAQPMLDSPRVFEVGQGRWLNAILLRNQGRNDEALKLARVGSTPDPLANGLITLESGDAKEAAAIFAVRVRRDESPFAPGIRARHLTWHNTLLGMALAAAGDTLAVRRLADIVENWGYRSNYGRDRRAHHYLRGMLLGAEGHDVEAAVELREAIHSRTHGFTRVNYELGKVLTRLNRPEEAVSVVRSALHGDIDGSNLYITRSELHELLAQAFDRIGQRDSTAVHYRAVVRAWEKADPPFHSRRQRARDWLARNAS